MTAPQSPQDARRLTAGTDAPSYARRRLTRLSRPRTTIGGG